MPFPALHCAAPREEEASADAMMVVQQPYLPDTILWRQKEQFSDGVGYSWIDGLKAHSERTVTDEQLAGAAQRYPLDTPETKEAYFIRQTFEGHFPSEAAAKTAVRWIPRAVSVIPLLFLQAELMVSLSLHRTGDALLTQVVAPSLFTRAPTSRLSRVGGKSEKGGRRGEVKNLESFASVCRGRVAC